MPPTRAPAATERVKLVELDGLRAWLAWWVVIGHMIIECGWNRTWLPAFGRVVMAPPLAVNVFIILSGFVIVLLLDTQRLGYRAFITARFFRLFPLYYVLLAINLIALPWLIAFYPDFLAKVGDPNNLHELFATWIGHRQRLFQHLGACVVGLHGCMPNAWLPNAHNAFVSQAWSISLEWQFYLVVPFVFGLIRRLRWLLVACVVAIVVVGVRELIPIGGWGAFLPMQVELFALGGVSYFAYKNVRLDGGADLYAKAMVCVVVLCLLLTSCFTTAIFSPWTDRNFVDRGISISVWVAILALMIARRHAADQRIVRWFSLPFCHPIATFLGRISYSTYLGHYLIIFLLQYASLHFFPNHLNKWTALGFQLGLGLPLVLTLSWFLYSFIELPGIQLGKRWLKRG
jgi:peptidoglycan/LPS O-acetylase OafA/YrhL